jgi:hypothetical protein
MPAVGLPIVDGGFAVPDGDEIILGEKAVIAQRRGEGGFGEKTSEVFAKHPRNRVEGVKTLEVWVRQKILPPSLQIWRICQLADLLTRDADQMLLHQPVEVFARLPMLLVLQRGLGLNRRVRQALDIPQLEPPRTVRVILQGGLGEGSELHVAVEYGEKKTVF